MYKKLVQPAVPPTVCRYRSRRVTYSLSLQVIKLNYVLNQAGIETIYRSII